MRLVSFKHFRLDLVCVTQAFGYSGSSGTALLAEIEALHNTVTANLVFLSSSRFASAVTRMTTMSAKGVK
jgi:hypothetical protein